MNGTRKKPKRKQRKELGKELRKGLRKRLRKELSKELRARKESVLLTDKRITKAAAIRKRLFEKDCF